MHIWTLRKWTKIYNTNAPQVRSGLRLRFDKDVNPEVKRACKEFAKWLRTEYYFPIRIPIYLKSSCFIKARDGELVSATFFGPDNKYIEPYIRVSTGDFVNDLKQRGKDNALASILGSIAHELTHYYQWINNIQLTEIGVERQAIQYARFILDEYKEVTDHP